MSSYDQVKAPRTAEPMILQATSYWVPNRSSTGPILVPTKAALGPCLLALDPCGRSLMEHTWKSRPAPPSGDKTWVPDRVPGGRAGFWLPTCPDQQTRCVASLQRETRCSKG
ncbi:hypothetical protein IF1G_04959 [Cordyceps javanica]|uniref:Uncharacterized protein n=1 Tax=Cordyceps javanica TaxID=43265 RepID=A0A545V3T7_9HYPO|nr:hypothetical protein IF1G_04959 [Cordyceps javanica]